MIHRTESGIGYEKTQVGEKTVVRTSTGATYEVIPQEDGRNLFVFEYMGKVFKIPTMTPEEKRIQEELKARDAAREEERRRQSLKDQSLMDAQFLECTFEKTSTTPENERVFRLAKNYVERWEEVKRENVGLIFYGAPGVGKSHVSFCIGNALLDKGVSVVVLSSTTLLRQMKMFQEFGSGEERIRFFNRVKNASLVILDDLGAEHGSAYGMSQLYEVLDYRYRQKTPMIITTNLSPTQLREHLTYGGVPRIYDRITEMCSPVLVEGSPRRIHEAERKRAFLQDLMEES